MNTPFTRPLKLAFAMGGGVSLGAFSGSALTETIKLAVLKLALEPEKCDYDCVEIDVFSGASAGSLSLAVMLRGLTWRTTSEEDAARSALIEELGQSTWRSINSEHQKDLIAVQAVMYLQQQNWVDGINIDKLLGDENPVRMEALRWSPGLLDSEAVYSLARSLMFPQNDEPVDVSNRRLLAERCLFGSTLTCLTPFVADATGTFNTSVGSAPGLQDALRSQVHKDMRIFDISFKKGGIDEKKVHENEQLEADLHRVLRDVKRMGVKEQVIEESQFENIFAKVLTVADRSGQEYMTRWFRLHNGLYKHGVAGDIRDKSAWANIAATSIACGSFPCAFPPAVLERYVWEYHPSQWPKDLPSKNTGEKRASHPFAYVDGGVFNNDPIREAFRMASFMDARDDRKTPIRRVIYVDPSVSPERPSLRVPAMIEMTNDSSGIFNLFSPHADAHKASFGRVFTLLGNMLATFIDQGRSREADAQAKTRDNFELRNRFRDAISQLVQYIDCQELPVRLHQHLVVGCAYCLERLYAEFIPPGDGSLVGELKRVIREMGTTSATPPDKAGAYVQYGFGPNGVDIKQAKEWLKIHLCLYLDLLLGLEGKNEMAEIIAITSYTLGDDNKPQAVKLSGDPLAAFAGFMSRIARQYDFDMGKHAAEVFLRLDEGKNDRKASLLPAPPAGKIWRNKRPKLPQGAERVAFVKELKVGVHKLRKRVEQMVNDGMGAFASIALWLVEGLNNVRGQIDENVEAVVADLYSDEIEPLDRRLAFEVAIVLPKEHWLQLDGKGPLDHDSKPQPLHRSAGLWKDKHVIWTSAVFVRHLDGSNQPKPDSGYWEGSAVRQKSYVVLERKGMHLGSWAHVHLPDAQTLNHLLMLDAKPNQEGQKPRVAHLRPVLKLELNKEETGPGGKPAGNWMKRWEYAEMAIPLFEILLAGDIKR